MASAKMMLSLLLSLAVPLLVGFSFIALLWPKREALRCHFLLKACLATAIGFGISSCAFFIWLSSLGARRERFVILEVLLLVVSLVILWNNLKERDSLRSSEPYSSPLSDAKMLTAASLGFYVALIL